MKNSKLDVFIFLVAAITFVSTIFCVIKAKRDADEWNW